MDEDPAEGAGEKFESPGVEDDAAKEDASVKLNMMAAKSQYSLTAVAVESSATFAPSKDDSVWPARMTRPSDPVATAFIMSSANVPSCGKKQTVRKKPQSM